MSKTTSIPVALTIAGSDSGGGAGIQADLKTFAALGVHGATTIVCVTAQNPRRVIAVKPCAPRLVRQQINAVFAELPPAAAKTGMLYSAAIIREVAGFFREHRRIPLVVDPVMIATNGAMLLRSHGLNALTRVLLPLATLVTPNLQEAARLIGEPLRSVLDMQIAARVIWHKFGCAVLVKGGHLRGSAEAADIFYDGTNELLLTAARIRGLRTHGTGCTYSAAITAYLARGLALPAAVTRGKEYISRAIEKSQVVEGYSVLNHFGNEK